MTNKAHKIRSLACNVQKLGFAAAIAFATNVVVLGNPTPALACGPESYVGTVCAFSFDWCPAGWLPTNGQAVAINQNQVLYSLLGNRFGSSLSNGSFNLPDLRGRAIIQQGQGAGLPNQAFGTVSGSPTTTLSLNNLPAHTHSATFAPVGGGTQTVNVPAAAGNLGVSAKLQAKDAIGTATPTTGAYLGKGPASGAGGASIYVNSQSQATLVELGGLDVQLTGAAGNGPISFTYQSGITGGTVSVGHSGNNQPFSTQSPSLALNYCIMAQGIYPNRP